MSQGKTLVKLVIIQMEFQVYFFETRRHQLLQFDLDSMHRIGCLLKMLFIDNRCSSNFVYTLYKKIKTDNNKSNIFCHTLNRHIRFGCCGDLIEFIFAIESFALSFHIKEFHRNHF